MNKEKALAKLGIRLTETLKERLEERAVEEGRTPSNLVVNIITKYLDDIDSAKKKLGQL